MPSLDWKGRAAVLTHADTVPCRLLHADPDLSVGDTGNLLVQGDNLHALKSLLPRYAGAVKCVYIDPPYNTGNEKWVYNDNVNAPEIRAWLKKTVDRDDLNRHDKWLCLMYPRLQLLKRFLRPDGAIFVSIDDNEVHHLRLLMDEIFGAQNFVTQIVWQKKVSPSNDAKWFSNDHEYLMVYAGDKNIWRPKRLPRSDEQRDYYRNPDDDVRGAWNSVAYTCNKSRTQRPNLYYAITQPNTGAEIFPKETAVWAYSRGVHEQHVADDLLYWGVDGTSRAPRYKKFLTDAGDIVPRSIFPYSEAGHTQEATSEFLKLFPGGGFDTPKPTRLIKRILQIATDKDSLVLDSFAGSGTTGHAVLDLNREDGGNRRFILVEMEDGIARNVTAERLRRVIARAEPSPTPPEPLAEPREPFTGSFELSAEFREPSAEPREPLAEFRESLAEPREGLAEARETLAEAREPSAEGFTFYTLGVPVVAEDGAIPPGVPDELLAQHIFYTETQTPLPHGVALPLLGVHETTAFYLLRGDYNDDTDADLPPHDGAKVVFADTVSRSDAARKAGNVVAKHLPYEIKRG